MNIVCGLLPYTGLFLLTRLNIHGGGGGWSGIRKRMDVAAPAVTRKTATFQRMSTCTTYRRFHIPFLASPVKGS